MTEETPELTETEKKIVSLKTSNLRMLNDLKNVGVGAELGIPRLEHFINNLRQLGIITYEQQLEEELDWQKSLRKQLQPTYQQVKAAAQLAGVPQQTPGGLIIPGRGNGARS